MLARERRLKLEDATGIASGNDVGSEMPNELGFAIAEGLGGVGLNEIVDAGRPAANCGFGNFGELESGNAREQSTRLRAHSLRMLQVAGIVKGHPQF